MQTLTFAEKINKLAPSSQINIRKGNQSLEWRDRRFFFYKSKVMISYFCREISLSNCFGRIFIFHLKIYEIFNKIHDYYILQNVEMLGCLVN